MFGVESRGSCHSPRRVFDPFHFHGGGDTAPAPPGNPHPLDPPLTPQAHLRHLRPLGPLRERGREEQRQTLALLRQRLPLVQYWGEGEWIHERGRECRGPGDGRPLLAFPGIQWCPTRPPCFIDISKMHSIFDMSLPRGEGRESEETGERASPRSLAGPRDGRGSRGVGVTLT